MLHLKKQSWLLYLLVSDDEDDDEQNGVEITDDKDER